MFSEVFILFKKKKDWVGPDWYFRFRACISAACLLGVAVYFVLLVVDLSKNEIYIVTSKRYTGEQGYNGSIPIPDEYIFSIQNNNVMANMSCILTTITGSTTIPECVGILEQALVTTPTQILYSPVFNNITQISDYTDCSIENNCPSPYYSLAIQFDFPPDDPSYSLSSVIIVEVSNTFIWPNDFTLSDPDISNKYELQRGDACEINFFWTQYYPVNKNPYYINTQQAVKYSYGSNHTKAALIFYYETDPITINAERYVTSFSNIIGLVGGLYSGVASIFVLIFGMGTISPWGILPKYIFRQSIGNDIRKHYSVTDPSNGVAGCPLTDPIDPATHDAEKSNNDDIVFIKNRLAKLEDLLARFYLDAEILASKEVTQVNNADTIV